MFKNFISGPVRVAPSKSPYLLTHLGGFCFFSEENKVLMDYIIHNPLKGLIPQQNKLLRYQGELEVISLF